VLVKAREGRPGESETMKQLNKMQREKAAALTAKFYADHPFVDAPGEFVAYKMSRTYVPNPKQYVGLVVQKLFNDNNFYKGKISEYDDRKQWWRVVYEDDGDEEDWSVPNMKKCVPTFKCGRTIDGVSEHTATAMRARSRRRIRTGRRENPVQDVLGELEQQHTVAKSGDTFELPDDHEDCSGTVWRLLRVYVDSDMVTKMGAYAPKDEVTEEMAEEASHLSKDELQAAYDVEIGPLTDIESWIRMTAKVAEIVEKHPNRRRGPSRAARNSS